MSKVAYAKDQRDKVKASGERLFCIQLTGKSGRGGITLSGPASADDVALIDEMLLKLINQRKPKVMP